MTGPQPLAGATQPPLDTDDDDGDEFVDTTGAPPDDIPNDDLTATEPPVAGGLVMDTDVDAPLVGTPPRDDEITEAVI